MLDIYLVLFYFLAALDATEVKMNGQVFLGHVALEFSNIYVGNLF